MSPPPPHKKHRQEHDAKNHQLEEPRRVCLGGGTGMTLYLRVPFPEGNTFLLIMALRSPYAFEVLKYSYTLFLFSTPYIGYSVLLSGLYIFALKAKQRIRAARFPLFPDPRTKNDLSPSLAKVPIPRKQTPPT